MLLNATGVRFAFPGERGFRLACDELTLAPGELAVARGGNGAGKSVLVRLLAGLLSPGSGRVEWAGVDRTGESPGAAAGFVPPLERGFHARLSARENLRFFGRLQGVAARDLEGRIASRAAALGADGRLDEPFGDLSSGFRQRINLIRALLHDPATLLLDEPERGLDGDGRDRLASLLRAHLARGGAALVATPQDPPALAVARRYRIVDGTVAPVA